jgi:Ca2+-dependent lipid-binding protein
VLAGRNLSVKDRRNADPYVVLTFDSEEYKTNIVEKDLNPIWDDEVFFL